MKSRPIGTGQNILASQNNDKRDDARGGSFLLAHQQLGALAMPNQPAANDTVTVTVNGTGITFTAVSGTPSAAGQVARGANALAFTTNILNALRRPDLQTSTYYPVSAGNQTLLSYVGYAWPGSSTNIIPFSLNKNVNGNTDVLTSFTISCSTSGNTWTSNTMALYVEDGTYYINGTRYFFTGGSSATVTAPVSHPRIDVLTIDTTGTLAWTTGTEASSPVAPSYPANKVPICELYNVVGETALYDNENQQSGQGYISNDVRPSMQYGIPFGAVPSDILPDSTNTRSLGSSGDQWLNIYGENVYVNGNPAAGSKFGGTGSDGALSITSGTTTLNLGGAAYFVKNYTSISITGTGALNFSNPNANGTIIVLKSQGNVTLTSSAAPMIDASSMGAAAGNGSYHSMSVTVAAPGSTSTSQTGANGGTAYAWPWAGAVVGKSIQLSTGAGGGGGKASTGGAGGVGGYGGAALLIECAGSWNFTTANGISVAGGAGSQPTAGSNNNGGGGGGGAAGSFYGFYNVLTANTGTVNITGGAGGAGGVGAAETPLLAVAAVVVARTPTTAAVVVVAQEQTQLPTEPEVAVAMALAGALAGQEVATVDSLGPEPQAMAVVVVVVVAQQDFHSSRKI